ncbi:MAG: IS110 family transposase [Anaerolineales bacterium]
MGNAPVLEHLKQISLDAAGIDIGSRQHYVAVPEGRDTEVVRSFGTFTADLHGLADWLQQCGIKTVAMESTGVYWIPIFEILEARGFDVKLVQPAKLKHAPGRKTDVLDCQWIQQLHTYGLLEGSFRPAEQVAVLRSYLRQRDRLVRLASQHIQHMQKALTEMNIQLHHVISDITGATGMRILEAIVAGERSPRQLAEMRDPNCKNSVETICLALTGNWREEHLFALQQALEFYQFHRQKIAEVDKRIEAHLKTFEDKSANRESIAEGEAKMARTKKQAKKKRKKRPHDPSFDIPSELQRITGVDLLAIDGIGPYIALALISEIGTDMSKWPTEEQFCSWLTLCPGNYKTGGKQHKSKTHTRPSSSRAAHLLRLAANSLWDADCALGAYFRRMKSRRGAPKAIVATAHKLARLVYRMLKYGTEYVDFGAEWYETRFKQQQLEGLKRKAKQLGFDLVETPT